MCAINKLYRVEIQRLSTIQESILLTQNLYPDSILFNITGYAVIKGEIDITVLGRAVNQILKSIDVISIGHKALNSGAGLFSEQLKSQIGN